MRSEIVRIRHVTRRATQMLDASDNDAASLCIKGSLVTLGIGGSASDVHDKTNRPIIFLLLESSTEPVDAGVTVEDKRTGLQSVTRPSQGRPRTATLLDQRAGLPHDDLYDRLETTLRALFIRGVLRRIHWTIGDTMLRYTVESIGRKRTQVLEVARHRNVHQSIRLVSVRPGASWSNWGGGEEIRIHDGGVFAVEGESFLWVSLP